MAVLALQPSARTALSDTPKGSRRTRRNLELICIPFGIQHSRELVDPTCGILRWTLHILLCLRRGARRFSDLRMAIPHISSNALTVPYQPVRVQLLRKCNEADVAPATPSALRHLRWAGRGVEARGEASDPLPQIPISDKARKI